MRKPYRRTEQLRTDMSEPNKLREEKIDRMLTFAVIAFAVIATAVIYFLKTRY